MGTKGTRKEQELHRFVGDAADVWCSYICKSTDILQMEVSRLPKNYAMEVNRGEKEIYEGHNSCGNKKTRNGKHLNGINNGK